MISFVIPGEPVAKGRARSFVRRRGASVSVGHFTPDKTRIAEATLAARAMEFRPPAPLSCPLILSATFVLPIPKSFSVWQREAAIAGEFRHVVKPDLDNLLKLLKDALNGVFWLDDRQIFSVENVGKFYGTLPHTRVRIDPLEQVTAEAWRAHKAKPLAFTAEDRR